VYVCLWVYVYVDMYVYGRHYVSLYVRVYMYMSACMSTRVRARMRLGRQHKRAQAINVRILTVVPLCYGKGARCVRTPWYCVKPLRLNHGWSGAV